MESAKGGFRMLFPKTAFLRFDLDDAYGQEGMGLVRIRPPDRRRKMARKLNM